MTTTHANRPQVDEMRKLLDEYRLANAALHSGNHKAFHNFDFDQLCQAHPELEEKVRKLAFNELYQMLDYIAYLEGLCGRAAIDLVATRYMDADRQLIDELKAVASVQTPDAAGEGGGSK